MTANRGLMVGCPACHQPIGVLCKRKDGRSFQPWMSHQARIDLSRMPGAMDAAFAQAQSELRRITEPLATGTWHPDGYVVDGDR